MSSDLQLRVVDALAPKPDWIRGDMLLWRPFDKAPVIYLVRFFGARACKVNLKAEQQPEPAEAMLRSIVPDELPDTLIRSLPDTTPKPVPFDRRVIVAPDLSNGALSKSTDFMAPVTCTAFPAYRCEFPDGDTRDELAFRLAKVVRWSDWQRNPSPAISARFQRQKSGVKSTGGKRLGIFPWTEIEKTLGFIDKEGGFIELENFERRRVNLVHEGGTFTITASEPSWSAPLPALIDWLRVFVVQGGDAAGRVRAGQ